MDLDKIITKCKKGKLLAQKQLYELFADRLYYICLRYVKQPETAQDILHDGFMIIYDKISQYKGEGSFEGWVKRIMVTTALAHLRKIDKERALFTLADDVSINQIDEQEEQNILSMDVVFRLLNDLPLGCRTIFNLYYVEGYSHKEIAAELGISEGTSKSQLSRAKDLLKLELKKKGGSYIV